MSGTVKIVLGLVVVLAVGAGALLLLEDDGVGQGVGGATVGSSAAEDDLRTDLPSAAEGDKSRLTAEAASPSDRVGAESAVGAADGEGAASLAPPKPMATLVGRAVDESGRAVPEARVVYLPGGGLALARRLGAGAELPEDPETSTDRDGRFSLTVEILDDTEDDDLPAILGGGGFGRLALAHEAFRTGIHECPRLTEGEVDLGTIVLTAGARVAGRVVDENGRPIADAEVSGRNLEARSGGMPFPVFGALGGRMAERLGSATTGPDGRFLVSGLGPGAAELTATAEGRQLGTVEGLELQPHETVDVGDVTLGAGETISGWVVADSGAPVEGAVIRVSSMTRIIVRNLEDMPRERIGNELRMRAETDADGWFELAGLTPGQYTVHVEADGYGRVDRDNVSTRTDDLRVTVRPLGGVLLTIVDEADGEPVDGAELHATAAPAGDFGFVFDNDALPVLVGEAALAAVGDAAGNARPEGLYLIQDVPPQGARVSIRAEGFAAHQVDSAPVDSGGTTRLIAALLPESILAGVVLDTGGAPVPDALVSVSEWEPPPQMDGMGGNFEVRREVRRTLGGPSGGGNGWRRVRSDDEGRFELRGVPAGTWELDATAKGFARSEPITADLEEGQRRDDLVLEVPVAGTIVGRVVERDGSAVPGVEVTVKPLESSASDPGAAIAAAFVGFDPTASNTTTDGNGEFVVDGLEPGPYEVALARRRGLTMGNAMLVLGGGAPEPAGDPGGRREVEVVAREEVTVELVRAPLAALSGQVVAGGRPVEGVTVSLNQEGSLLPFGGSRVETDRFGRFEFVDVQPGEYELSAVAPGAALPAKAPVELLGGESSSQDLVFSGATLAGQVVDADSGQGVEGVTINLLPTEQRSGGLQAQGNFAFSFVSSGPGGGGGMQIDMTDGPMSRVRTGPDGRFEALWVPPGEYTLQADGGGIITTEVGPVDVADAQLVDDLLVKAPRGAVIRGLITNVENGELMSGTAVTLVSDGGRSRDMTVAEEGRYQFEGLAPGEYSVQVMGSGFGGAPLATEDVVLAQGEERVVDLDVAFGAQGGGIGGGRTLSITIGGDDGG